MSFSRRSSATESLGWDSFDPDRSTPRAASLAKDTSPPSADVSDSKFTGLDGVPTNNDDAELEDDSFADVLGDFDIGRFSPSLSHHHHHHHHHTSHSNNDDHDGASPQSVSTTPSESIAAAHSPTDDSAAPVLAGRAGSSPPPPPLKPLNAAYFSSDFSAFDARPDVAAAASTTETTISFSESSASRQQRHEADVQTRGNGQRRGTLSPSASGLQRGDDLADSVLLKERDGNSPSTRSLEALPLMDLGLDAASPKKPELPAPDTTFAPKSESSWNANNTSNNNASLGWSTFDASNANAASGATHGGASDYSASFPSQRKRVSFSLSSPRGGPAGHGLASSFEGAKRLSSSSGGSSDDADINGSDGTAGGLLPIFSSTSTVPRTATLPPRPPRAYGTASPSLRAKKRVSSVSIVNDSNESDSAAAAPLPSLPALTSAPTSSQDAADDELGSLSLSRGSPSPNNAASGRRDRGGRRDSLAALWEASDVHGNVPAPPPAATGAPPPRSSSFRSDSAASLEWSGRPIGSDDAPRPHPPSGRRRSILRRSSSFGTETLSAAPRIVRRVSKGLHRGKPLVVDAGAWKADLEHAADIRVADLRRREARAFAAILTAVGMEEYSLPLEGRRRSAQVRARIVAAEADVRGVVAVFEEGIERITAIEEPFRRIVVICEETVALESMMRAFVRGLHDAQLQERHMLPPRVPWSVSVSPARARQQLAMLPSGSRPQSEATLSSTIPPSSQRRTVSLPRLSSSVAVVTASRSPASPRYDGPGGIPQLSADVYGGGAAFGPLPSVRITAAVSKFDAVFGRHGVLVKSNRPS